MTTYTQKQSAPHDKQNPKRNRILFFVVTLATTVAIVNCEAPETQRAQQSDALTLTDTVERYCYFYDNQPDEPVEGSDPVQTSCHVVCDTEHPQINHKNGRVCDYKIHTVMCDEDNEPSYASVTEGDDLTGMWDSSCKYERVDGSNGPVPGCEDMWETATVRPNLECDNCTFWEVKLMCQCDFVYDDTDVERCTDDVFPVEGFLPLPQETQKVCAASGGCAVDKGNVFIEEEIDYDDIANHDAACQKMCSAAGRKDPRVPCFSGGSFSRFVGRYASNAPSNTSKDCGTCEC